MQRRLVDVHCRPLPEAKGPPPRQASQPRDLDEEQVPGRPMCAAATTGLVRCRAQLTFFFFSRRLLWQTEKVLTVAT